MKKKLKVITSIMLALLMISSLVLNALASALPKSEIVDLDMSKVKINGINQHDDICLNDLNICNDNEGDYTIYKSSDYIFYTADDINYNEIVVKDIRISTPEFSDYKVNCLVNDDVIFQNGVYHFCAVVENYDELVYQTCLETADFKNFTLNDNPHLVDQYVIYTESTNEDEYEYLEIKAVTDCGYYLLDNYYSPYIASVYFSKDLKTFDKILDGNDILDEGIIDPIVLDNYYYDIRPTLNFEKCENGVLVSINSRFMHYNSIENENAPLPLYYINKNNDVIAVDMSAVDYPEIDKDNLKGAYCYTVTTKTGEILYLVRSYTAFVDETITDEFENKLRIKNSKCDVYIFNEETLRLEKVGNDYICDSLNNYVNYTWAIYTNNCGVITGERTDGTYAATVSYEDIVSEYETGLDFNRWVYATIYDEDEDFYSIHHVALTTRNSNDMYYTVDDFKTIYRLDLSTLGEYKIIAFDSWTINGNYILFCSNDDVLDCDAEVKIYIIDEQSILDAIPGYNPEPTPPDEPTPDETKTGDANGDGKVSVVDAKWILQSVANTRTLTDEQKANADVNKDGKISVVDAKWILQAVAGTRVL